MRAQRVNFAKAKSDVIAKADGSFQPRPKRKTSDGPRPLPAARAVLPGAHLLLGADAQPKHLAAGSKKKQQTGEGAPSAPSRQQPEGQSSAAPMSIVETMEPPNRILFVQNLPEEVTQQMLSLLFGQCVLAGAARAPRGFC